MNWLKNIGQFALGMLGGGAPVQTGVPQASAYGAASAGAKFFDRALGAYRTVDSALAERRERKSVEATNRAQMGLAREQMDFQERMSSTAFQRQQRDLAAAGLPKWFSNQPASSAQGAMADLEVPMRGKAKLALERQLNAMQLEQGASATALNHQLARTQQSQQALNAGQALIAAQQLRSATAKAKQDEQAAGISTSDWGKTLAWIDRWVQSLSPFSVKER